MAARDRLNASVAVPTEKILTEIVLKWFTFTTVIMSTSMDVSMVTSNLIRGLRGDVKCAVDCLVAEWTESTWNKVNFLFSTASPVRLGPKCCT